MRTDLEIAQRARLRPITEIASALHIDEDELELHGKYKAKVALAVLKRLAGRPAGKYIDVTAVTPTPLGEGKTTTTIGLAMALNRIGCSTIAAIRQPSLGPVFGIKGGLPAAAMRKWCRWRTSISISPVTCTRSRSHTTSSPR